MRCEHIVGRENDRPVECDAPATCWVEFQIVDEVERQQVEYDGYRCDEHHPARLDLHRDERLRVVGEMQVRTPLDQDPDYLAHMESLADQRFGR